MPIIKFTTVFSVTIFIMLLPFLIFINGCDDAGVTPPTTDSNVVIIHDLTPTLWFNGTYDTSHQAVNLYDGILERGISGYKDMVLIDLNSDTTNFYFRSGDLSVDANGKKTRFNRIYPNLDSSYKFDSISVIPVSSGVLDSLSFTQDDTRQWGYLTVGLTTHPVFSFYLSGKYMSGETHGYRVYGMFYIKKVERVYTPLYGGSPGFQVTIDVKYNKVGANHFVP
jgi:hypothetical protein